MIKYPIYVTLDTNIMDAANYDFEEKSTLQILINYVKKGQVKVVLSNIVVVSIVGRYLEHSRIYIFGTGNERKVYIASADFMTRNTIRRVEVALPILDEDIKTRIVEMFDLQFSDDEKGKEQDEKVSTRKEISVMFL